MAEWEFSLGLNSLEAGVFRPPCIRRPIPALSAAAVVAAMWLEVGGLLVVGSKAHRSGAGGAPSQSTAEGRQSEQRPAVDFSARHPLPQPLHFDSTTRRLAAIAKANGPPLSRVA
jgi:hypothetical protein